MVSAAAAANSAEIGQVVAAGGRLLAAAVTSVAALHCRHR
jgi:hypothetical protein